MVNKYLQRIVITLLPGAFVLAYSGCNTVHGVGKDMQKTGEEIGGAVDEHSGHGQGSVTTNNLDR